jgi:hypothetical protein
VGAPMPGNIIGVKMKVGDTVEKGKPLVVMSAMKMEVCVVLAIVDTNGRGGSWYWADLCAFMLVFAMFVGIVFWS